MWTLLSQQAGEPAGSGLQVQISFLWVVVSMLVLFSKPSHGGSDLCQRYATRVCDLAVISLVVQLLKSFLFSLRSNPCLYSSGMKPGAPKQLYKVNCSKHAFCNVSCTFWCSGPLLLVPGWDLGLYLPCSAT